MSSQKVLGNSLISVQMIDRQKKNHHPSRLTRQIKQENINQKHRKVQKRTGFQHFLEDKGKAVIA